MNKILIHEVGLRDGLQMEMQTVPMDQKITWINELVKANIDIIQLGSFVHRERVPQMADTDAIFNRFKQIDLKPKHTILSALVLNERGLERGLACGVEMFCMGVSASDTHSRKNSGMSSEEATPRIITMAKSALKEGKRVQVSVQSAFGCGFEGEVPAERVMAIVRKYLQADLKSISLADTAGHAHPDQVKQLFEQIFMLEPSAECACHFHNTYGMGLANCVAAMEVGVTSFESSFGGLGGCPFTKVAAGNVCTEDLVHFLQRTGRRKDIALDVLIPLARDVAEFFRRDLPGLVYKAGPVPTLAPQKLSSQPN